MSSLYKDEQGNIRSSKSGNIEKILVEKPFGKSYYITPSPSLPSPELCSHKNNDGSARSGIKFCSSTLCPIACGWTGTWFGIRHSCRYGIYGHWRYKKRGKGLVFVKEPNPNRKRTVSSEKSEEIAPGVGDGGNTQEMRESSYTSPAPRPQKTFPAKDSRRGKK